jgi:hypothetical protein
VEASLLVIVQNEAGRGQRITRFEIHGAPVHDSSKEVAGPCGLSVLRGAQAPIEKVASGRRQLAVRAQRGTATSAGLSVGLVWRTTGTYRTRQDHRHSPRERGYFDRTRGMISSTGQPQLNLIRRNENLHQDAAHSDVGGSAGPG